MKALVLLVSRRSSRAGISDVFHPNEAGVTLSQVSDPEGGKYIVLVTTGTSLVHEGSKTVIKRSKDILFIDYSGFSNFLSNHPGQKA
jgi:hypothetical protein